jgi:hypothetical protein
MRGDRTPTFKSGKGTRAVVMTIVRDEFAMLPRWLDYYGGQVGLENLVVFDDGSTDGSTDSLPCTVHRLPELNMRHVPFERARMDLVSGLARGLLSWYDLAIFVDVDEFLVPDPAQHDGLTDYLAARAERKVMAPLALNVVHHVTAEPDLDPTRPVLEQRQYAKFVPGMCKPSIKRIPAKWTAASHGVRAPFAVDPALFMLHLKFSDRAALRRSADHRRAMFEADGHASGSNWWRGGDEMVNRLGQFTKDVDPATVEEFDPSAVDLSGVVIQGPKAGFRTMKQGQLRAMARQPLVRIPERLVGAL